jgi:hypothetical protein
MVGLLFIKLITSDPIWRRRAADANAITGCWRAASEWILKLRYMERLTKHFLQLVHGAILYNAEWSEKEPLLTTTTITIEGKEEPMS